METLQNFTDEQLKQELERRGYFTRNLWHLNDARKALSDAGKESRSDDECMELLESAITNSSVMEHIWFAMDQKLNDE